MLWFLALMVHSILLSVVRPYDRQFTGSSKHSLTVTPSPSNTVTCDVMILAVHVVHHGFDNDIHNYSI